MIVACRGERRNVDSAASRGISVNPDNSGWSPDVSFKDGGARQAFVAIFGFSHARMWLSGFVPELRKAIVTLRSSSFRRWLVVRWQRN